MAGTVTPFGRHNTNYSIGAATHYGFKVQCGLYTPSTGTTQYTSVGDSLTFSGMTGAYAVTFGIPGYTTGPSTNAQHYVWDYTNQSVRWMMSSTGGVTEATTAAAASGTAYYFAIGY